VSYYCITYKNPPVPYFIVIGAMTEKNTARNGNIGAESTIRDMFW
jgi:hypothetical protein